MFSAMGRARGSLRLLFSVFFRFPIVFTIVFLVSDRFFCFSDRIYDRFSVSDRFFRFYSFFSGDVFSTSVFTGAIRLHAARALAETSGNPRNSAKDYSGSELRVIKGVIQGIRSPLSIYLSIYLSLSLSLSLSIYISLYTRSNALYSPLDNT